MTMRARGTLRFAPALLVVLCMTTISACRELTAPPGEPTQPDQSLLVLDLDGQPLPKARVSISNIGFVRLQDELEWEGDATEDGFVYPDLPSGPYSAEVRPWSFEDGSWAFSRLEVSGRHDVLDPRPHVRPGHIDVPEEFRDDVFSLNFVASVKLDARTRSFVSRSRVDPGGHFYMVWDPDAQYATQLNGNGLTVRLEDGLAGSLADSVLLAWNPVVSEVDLTMGGAPLPAGPVSLIAVSPDFRVRVSRVVSGPTVSFYCNREPGSLRIEPSRYMRFMARTVQVDFGGSDTPHVELGEHLVELRFVTDGGLELLGGRVSLDHVDSRERLNLFDLASLELVYLRSGQHVMNANAPGFESVGLVCTIDQDTTLTFVMTPESATDQ